MAGWDGIWTHAGSLLSATDSEVDYSSGLNSADVREVMCALNQVSALMDRQDVQREASRVLGEPAQINTLVMSSPDALSSSVPQSGEMTPVDGPGVMTTQDSLVLMRRKEQTRAH